VTRVGGLDDLVTRRAKGSAQGLEDLFLVVNEQDRAAAGGHQDA
jgi:hypothetical protein